MEIVLEIVSSFFIDFSASNATLKLVLYFSGLVLSRNHCKQINLGSLKFMIFVADDLVKLLSLL